MKGIYLGVGSNIEPEANVRAALQHLSRTVSMVGLSTFYATAPLDRPAQPFFYNGVVEVETETPPRDLKYRVLRGIEGKLGRQRTADPYAPRTIDLDLLIYGDWVQNTEGLVIPDPEISQRPFLTLPLYELAPDLVLPDSGRPLREIAASFSPRSMQPLLEFSQQLKKEFANHEYGEGGKTGPGTAPGNRRGPRPRGVDQDSPPGGEGP